MNIGILTINDFKFHPNARLRQAALNLGHNIILINPYNITAGIKKGLFEFSIDTIPDQLDIVMPRQGSPMGDYGLVLLRHFNNLNIPIVNNVNAITISRNQYITLQVLAASSLPVPNTYFITKKESFAKAVKQVGGFPAVIKQVNGMGGDGVIKVNDAQSARGFLSQILKEKKGVLIQQFIRPETRTDIRVLVIGGKIAGAMKIKPRHSDFRTNIHQQGRPEKFELSMELENLALQAAKVCDLQIAGVDIIMENNGNPLIIEVNYSPGFRGLEAATRIDIAKKIINYVTAHENI
jgi:ribosomal protein S6--L-glutamate ligase